MKKLLSLIIFLLFALFAFSLNLQNPGSITLKYYFGLEAQVDLYVVLLVPFVIGLLLGVLLMSITVFRNKMQAGKVKRKLAKVEKEVENLRAAPVSEPMPGSASSSISNENAS